MPEAVFVSLMFLDLALEAGVWLSLIPVDHTDAKSQVLGTVLVQTRFRGACGSCL
jgi:hypothetical protein